LIHTGHFYVIKDYPIGCRTRYTSLQINTIAKRIKPAAITQKRKTRISFYARCKILSIFPIFQPTTSRNKINTPQNGVVNDLKSMTNPPKPQNHYVLDGLLPPIDKKQPQRPSEILPALLGFQAAGPASVITGEIIHNMGQEEDESLKEPVCLGCSRVQVAGLRSSRLRASSGCGGCFYFQERDFALLTIPLAISGKMSL
jgi:hypothetical protein